MVAWTGSTTINPIIIRVYYMNQPNELPVSHTPMNIRVLHVDKSIKIRGRLICWMSKSVTVGAPDLSLIDTCVVCTWGQNDERISFQLTQGSSLSSILGCTYSVDS